MKLILYEMKHMPETLGLFERSFLGYEKIDYGFKFSRGITFENMGLRK